MKFERQSNGSIKYKKRGDTRPIQLTKYFQDRFNYNCKPHTFFYHRSNQAKYFFDLSCFFAISTGVFDLTNIYERLGHLG